MRATVISEIEYDIEIPDERIPDILKDFRESIQSNATERDLFEHIVHNDLLGDNVFVEGIGKLSDEGIIVKRGNAGYEAWIEPEDE